MEDKDIFTGLFVPPYLHACLLCRDDDLPGTGEKGSPLQKGNFIWL